MPAPRFYGHVNTPQAFTLEVGEQRAIESPKGIDGWDAVPHEEPARSPNKVVAKEVPTGLLNSRDLKTILIDFRHDWEAAMLRQEAVTKHILEAQSEIQRNVATVLRRTANGILTDPQVDLQLGNQNGGKDILKDDLQIDAPRPSPPSTLRVNWTNSMEPMSPKASQHQLRKAQHLLGLIKDKHHFAFGVKDIADEDHESLRSRINRFLSCKECELTVSFLIVCNAITICLESQYHGLEVGFKLQFAGRSQPAEDTWPAAEPIFQCCDWIFGVVFLVEFFLKFVVWQFGYFYDYWNVLDFLCVVSFLVDKIATANSRFNAMPLRLLRLFRLARLVRLIRFLEHLEALYVMTTAIGGLSRTLGWAIFLLTVMLLTCDLFLVQLLQATYFSDVEAGDLTEPQLEMHQRMWEYFGTSTRCMLSMFEITLANWPPVARLLTEEVSEWFMLLLLVHKLTLGFAVLGVINGVILQETFKVAQTDDIIMLRHKRKATANMKSKMNRLFHALDSDGDGKVTEMEFLEMCEYPDVKIWLSSLDIETDDLSTLFKLCDLNGNGVLSLDEVVSRLPRIKGSARSIDVLSLLHRDSISSKSDSTELF